MITGNDNLVTMRQFAEPVVEVDNRRLTAGEHGEIAGMNQNIAVWNADLAMPLVDVGQNDKAKDPR